MLRVLNVSNWNFEWLKCKFLKVEKEKGKISIYRKVLYISSLFFWSLVWKTKAVSNSRCISFLLPLQYKKIDIEPFSTESIFTINITFTLKTSIGHCTNNQNPNIILFFCPSPLRPRKTKQNPQIVTWSLVLVLCDMDGELGLGMTLLILLTYTYISKMPKLKK